MIGRARRRAAAILDSNVEVFARAGYREAERPSPLEARLESDGTRPLVVRMAQEGRIFGGTYALEVATAEPVLPATAGLRARGRGVVRLRRIAFRARGRDAAGGRLAAQLESDPGLAEALRRVHFDRIRVEPDGRPVIRHMGGSLVWVLFPPVVRPIPFLDEQARATASALEAFAHAGR